MLRLLLQRRQLSTELTTAQEAVADADARQSEACLCTWCIWRPLQFHQAASAVEHRLCGPQADRAAEESATVWAARDAETSAALNAAAASIANTESALAQANW